MGKSLRHQDSSISLHGHPGCMWSILNLLHQHRWYHIKKRLPYKRHGGRKPTAVVGDSGSRTTTTDVNEVHKKIKAEMDKSLIGEKTVEPSPITKISMKSRIKALIAEELSKRIRGRHRRSTSCPTRTPLPQTNSIHHLEPIDFDTSNPLAANDETPGTINQDNIDLCLSSTLEYLTPKACEEEPVTSNKNCEYCAAMLSVSYYEDGKELVEDNLEDTKQDLLEQKSIRVEEGSKDILLEESMQFLDALDIFNTRKELFLKILQDPSSHVAHYLHSHRAFNPKTGLTKSVSFPLCGSAAKGVIRPSSSKSKEMTGSAETMDEHSFTLTEECRRDDISKPVLSKTEYFEKPFSPGSPLVLKNNGGNKRVIKRFKNLRQKIRHAIRESRKERHRIMMDSVLHKVPYGRSFSKEVKGGTVDLQEPFVVEKWSKYSPRSSSGSDQSRGMRRAASCNESLDRYCHLFERSFNRERKNDVPERLKLKEEETPSPGRSNPKSLGRIYSLPDLRSYSYLGSEDTPSSLGMPARIVVDANVDIGSCRFDEQKTSGLLVGPENKIQLDTSAESGDHENLVGGETLHDLGNEITWASASHEQQKIGSTLNPVSMEAKPTSVSVTDSNFHESTTGPAKFCVSEDSELTPRPVLFHGADSLANPQHELGADSLIMDESTVNSQDIEKSVRKSYDDFLHVELDIEESAEFNYVSDVLQLSGFSGNEFLGTWHSTDQPLDPLMFEEVEEGCLFAEPDCSVKEEAHKFNHLLLFDLINEVLLEIYERSFTYCPMPLSCRSHIRPMPLGYHVLEEVWADISCYLSWRPEADQPLDDAVSRDLAKSDGWMNLQFDAVCVGLELEDIIFDDLLEELIWT